VRLPPRKRWTDGCKQECSAIFIYHQLVPCRLEIKCRGATRRNGTGKTAAATTTTIEAAQMGVMYNAAQIGGCFQAVTKVERHISATKIAVAIGGRVKLLPRLLPLPLPLLLLQLMPLVLLVMAIHLVEMTVQMRTIMTRLSGQGVGMRRFWQQRW
jgi:hypothetical protein